MPKNNPAEALVECGAQREVASPQACRVVFGEEHVLSPEVLNTLEMISVNIPIQYNQKNIWWKIRVY